MLTASLIVAAASEPLAAQSDTVVVAGQRLGPVALGMPRADVVRVLGAPTKTYNQPHGSLRYDYDQGHLRLLIVFSGIPDVTVVSVTTSSSTFQTDRGVRVGSTGNDVVRAHGGGYASSSGPRGGWVCYPTGLWFDVTAENVVRTVGVMTSPCP